MTNKMLGTDTIWNQVISALCRQGIEWIKIVQGAIESFLNKAMDCHAKILHYFIESKLLLMTNFSAMQKKGAALIHAI